MKKLVPSLVVMAVALTGPVASAGEPYPGSVATRTSASGDQVIEVDTRPVTRVRVRAASNADPRGQVHVRYVRVKGGFKASVTKRYRGDRIRVKGPVLPRKGKYDVRVRFVPKPDSVWRASSDSYRVKVVR